jgi:hypothetical protein
MEVPVCAYVKTGGGRCGSPAVKDHPYRYYHLRLRHHIPIAELFCDIGPITTPGQMPTIASWDFPLLDDRAAIQIGFMQVVYGVAHGHLNPKQARLVLGALNGASVNLKLMERAVAQLRKQERTEVKKPPASVKESAKPNAKRQSR